MTQREKDIANILYLEKQMYSVVSEVLENSGSSTAILRALDVIDEISGFDFELRKLNDKQIMFIVLLYTTIAQIATRTQLGLLSGVNNYIKSIEYQNLIDKYLKNQ